VKSLSFCFLCSDDDDPKRDAAIASSAENIAADDPSVQEVEPAVKSQKAPRAPVKKVPVAWNSKRLKKSKGTDVSLEAHGSMNSPDDVRGDLSLFAFCSLRDLYAHMLFPWQILMKKFVTLGTECAEYFKDARASKGAHLSYTLLVSSTFLCFFIILISPCFQL
jgi:hypothetical protein